MFLSHLYGGMDEPEMKIIDVFYPRKLRKKLANASGGNDYIENGLAARLYVMREQGQVSALIPGLAQ